MLTSSFPPSRPPHPQRAVLKTQALVSPFEPAFEKVVGFFSDLLSSLTGKINRLSSIQKGLAAAVLVAVLAALAMCVTVPALLFFPVTLFVLGCVFLGSLVAMPLLMVGGWIALCTRPVQDKVVGPVVERVLRVQRLKKLLTLD